MDIPEKKCTLSMAPCGVSPQGSQLNCGWDLTEDWRSCISSCGNILAMAVKVTSFLLGAGETCGKFKLQIIILSLEFASGPCDFRNFLLRSVSLWLLVKYQGSRRVRGATCCLSSLELEAPTPGSFTHSLICKKGKALLLIPYDCPLL